jgi:melibiose permease
MTVLPIIGLAAAVIIFRKKYILTEEKVAEIAEELKNREINV